MRREGSITLLELPILSGLGVIEVVLGITMEFLEKYHFHFLIARNEIVKQAKVNLIAELLSLLICLISNSIDYQSIWYGGRKLSN